MSQISIYNSLDNSSIGSEAQQAQAWQALFWLAISTFPKTELSTDVGFRRWLQTLASVVGFRRWHLCLDYT